MPQPAAKKAKPSPKPQGAFGKGDMRTYAQPTPKVKNEPAAKVKAEPVDADSKAAFAVWQKKVVGQSYAYYKQRSDKWFAELWKRRETCITHPDFADFLLTQKVPDLDGKLGFAVKNPKEWCDKFDAYVKGKPCREEPANETFEDALAAATAEALARVDQDVNMQQQPFTAEDGADGDETAR